MLLSTVWHAAVSVNFYSLVPCCLGSSLALSEGVPTQFGCRTNVSAIPFPLNLRPLYAHCAPRTKSPIFPSLPWPVVYRPKSMSQYSPVVRYKEAQWRPTMALLIFRPLSNHAFLTSASSAPFTNHFYSVSSCRSSESPRRYHRLVVESH